MNEYEILGQRWLRGEVDIDSFNGISLNKKQAEFVNAKDRFCLVSGGFASGKTTGFIVKLYLLSQFFPGNLILLGRKSRADVEAVTLNDIIDIFPVGTYEHKVGPGKIVFPNGSEIIFFGLDTLQSGSGDDIKKARQKMKGLNLGAYFIDQLEEIDQKVFEELDGRLRRNIPFRQANMTTNPANFWAYDFFKVNPRPNTRLIETSMLDNKDNLPPDYIESQMNKGEMYVKRYVYGQWDKDSLVDGTVFGSDVIHEQSLYVRKPLRELGGIKVYVEPEQMHEYQIGIDPSTGSVDPSGIVVVDKMTGSVVATWRGYTPINVTSMKACILADMYSSGDKKPLMIPEATGVGQALVEDLKKSYDRIYEREIFNQREKVKTRKLGFYTNYATKIQLIENMNKLFQAHFPKIHEYAIVDELKTFVYTDEAQKKGAGAQSGNHDDMTMAMLLAFVDVKAVSYREKSILENRQKKEVVVTYEYE